MLRWLAGGTGIFRRGYLCFGRDAFILFFFFFAKKAGAFLPGWQSFGFFGLINKIPKQFGLEETFGGHLGVGVCVGVYGGVPGTCPGAMQPSKPCSQQAGVTQRHNLAVVVTSSPLPPGPRCCSRVAAARPLKTGRLPSPHHPVAAVPRWGCLWEEGPLGRCGVSLVKDFQRRS